MSWKKAGILVIVFAALFLAFFLTDEKSPESTEVNFWKVDFDSLNYTGQMEGSDSFLKESFSIERVSLGWKENPIFLLKGKDPKSGTPYVYEAGFSSKNLFNDLSVLRTKVMTDSSPDLLEKFSIGEKTSPRIELLREGNLEKTILLGKETKDKTARMAQADGFIISIHSYTCNKFTGDKTQLRERQYLPLGAIQLKRMQIQSDNLFLELENRYTTENTVVQQNWFKKTGKMSRLSPTTSSRLDSLLRSLPIELFPDSEKGGGFEIIGELVKDKEMAKWEIELSNGKFYTLYLYSPTNLESVDYVPAKKVLKGVYEESPVYLKMSSVQDIQQLWKTIKEEQEWQDQNKKK